MYVHKTRYFTAFTDRILDLQQTEYVKWLQSQGIVVEAYSPFGNLNPVYSVGSEGRIIDKAEVKEIAEKYGKSPSQVVLSWGVA